MFIEKNIHHYPKAAVARWQPTNGAIKNYQQVNH